MDAARPGTTHNDLVTQWWVPGDDVGTELDCPRCGGPSDMAQHGTPGVLSRWDQLTVICSSCATHEAMLVLRDRASLHPVTGQRVWTQRPTTA